MDQRWLEAYILEMPVIEADEALKAVQIGLASSPSQSDEEVEAKQRIIKAFEEQAVTEQEKARRKLAERDRKRNIAQLNAVFNHFGAISKALLG